MPESLTLAEDTAARFNFSGDGKRFSLSFIQPGLVSYREMKGGTVELLRKPTIDATVGALKGKSIVIGHPTGLTNDQITEWATVNSIGTVEEVRFNAADGLYWAEGTVTKPESVKPSMRPSVVFMPRSFGPAGTYNDMPYGRELLAVDFDHIALVEQKPRYSEATFRFNASGNQPNTTMFNWTRKIFKKATDAAGITTEQAATETGQLPANATVDLGDGQSVSLSDLTASYAARQNAAATEIPADAEIEVGGKLVKVADLIASERTARLNASGADAAKTAAKKKADDDAAAEQARLNAAGTPFFIKLASAASVSAGQKFGTAIAPDAATARADRIKTSFGPNRL